MESGRVDKGGAKMTLREFITRLVKEHIVDDFPYPSWCFDCNTESCEGCTKVRDEDPIKEADDVQSWYEN